MPTQKTDRPIEAEIVTPEPVSEVIRRMISDNEATVRDEMRHYYTALQLDYTARVAEIEKFLGFLESAEGLGRRLERLEQFLGIKG